MTPDGRGIRGFALPAVPVTAVPAVPAQLPAQHNGPHAHGQFGNGPRINGPRINGQLGNGQLVNGQLANGQFGNGQLVNGQLANGQLPDPLAGYVPGYVTAAQGSDVFRVLHVCTGNVCRSPMAERLMRHGLSRRLGDDAAGILVESSGTWGHEGAPMEAHAAAVLGEFGADPAGFTGRELLDDHVIGADLVLTATRDHRAQVISMGHAAGLRTFTLKEFTRLVRAIDEATLPDEGGVTERARALVRAAAALRGWLLAPSPDADEVHDPYGAPVSYFRSIGEEIHTALDPVVTALTGIPAPATV